MSTNLISKMFETVQVRFVLDNNKVPWFVGKDIALALGYINTAQAVREKCREPKPLKDIGCYQSAPQQNQGLASDPSDLDPQTKMIKRADVSRLIARAKVTDKTEKFETWLFDDVLESIYDTGSYTYKQQTNTLDEEFKSTVLATLEQLKHVLPILTMKSNSYDLIMESNLDFSLDQAAKLLCDQSQIIKVENIGRNKLCEILRKRGIFDKDNVAHQRYIDSGYFTYKISILKGIQIFSSTRVTPKGINFLIGELKVEKILPIVLYN